MTHLAVHSDGSAVALNDALADVQTEAQAASQCALRLYPLGAVKLLPDALKLGRGQPRSVVFDGHTRPSIRDPHPNAHRLVSWRVLQRIRQAARFRGERAYRCRAHR